MKATLRLVGLVLVLLVLVLWLYVTPVTAQEWVNVTDERLLNADWDPSNWLTYYRTYNGWRYSPLSQVNRQTVQKLVPKWMFSLGEVGNQEGTGSQQRDYDCHCRRSQPSSGSVFMP